MTRLTIYIESYGEIKKQLPDLLTFEFLQAEISVRQVLAQLLQQFPNIESTLERCACAVGDEMLSRESILTKDCTLVLLSPVAGG